MATRDCLFPSSLRRQEEILNSLSTVAYNLVPYVHVLPKCKAVGKQNLSASAVPCEQGTSLSSSCLKESLCKV